MGKRTKPKETKQQPKGRTTSAATATEARRGRSTRDPRAMEHRHVLSGVADLRLIVADLGERHPGQRTLGHYVPSRNLDRLLAVAGAALALWDGAGDVDAERDALGALMAAVRFDEPAPSLALWDGEGRTRATTSRSRRRARKPGKRGAR